MKKRKILLADRSVELLEKILSHEKANDFTFITATDGEECLKKALKEEPDLVILEFMLPKVHGIEIIGELHKNPSLKNTGVILTDYHCLPQNYNHTTIQKLNYLLPKPFLVDDLFVLVSRFFTDGLSPSSLVDLYPREKHLSPSPFQNASTYLKFWGTRGSYPVAGKEYSRFGGNTPCLEIRSKKNIVIIDAGTGIRSLGQSLTGTNYEEIPILFSHTHWDHLLGLPFFYPLHEENQKITAFLPVGLEKRGEEIFTDIFDYTYFPVAYEDIKAKIHFVDLRDSSSLHFGDILVQTHYAFHPGATLCFKVFLEGKTIGYVTDNEFLQGNLSSIPSDTPLDDLLSPYESLITFLTGCDILIHEAQYTHEEYTTRVGWGHSSMYNASLLIKQANIKEWIITHHDPRHTDEMLLEKAEKHKEILMLLQHECRVDFAFDGMILPLDQK